MTSTTHFINGVLDNQRVDIIVADGFIQKIASPDERLLSPQDSIIDLAGKLVLPPLAEPHAHLDKAFLADRITNESGDLLGAIQGLESIRSSITHEDIVQRACEAAVLMSRNGVTAVRTHADTTLSGGLMSVLALLETKQRCAHFIDIQVAALLDWPITGPQSADRLALARSAIEAGVDVIGGCPHLDDQPQQAVESLLELAMESGVPLDLHADENLRPESSDLENLADIMLREGITHNVTASHCVALSARSVPDIQHISEKVAAAHIAVVALPLTNLFLQARGVTTLPPRGLTPSRLLRNAGVVVAAGADNLQDPFNLMGRGDPLETASLMVVAAHESPQIAFDMVTTNSHHVISPRRSFLSPGDKADFVALQTTNVREAIAMGPPDRTVVYGGVVITEEKRNIK